MTRFAPHRSAQAMLLVLCASTSASWAADALPADVVAFAQRKAAMPD